MRNQIKLKLSWIGTFVGLLSVTALQAETIRVGGDQADYATIPEGVAAASDGDTILIAPGFFNIPETIKLNDKSIQLIGSGPWKTIVTWSGPNNGAVFEITGPNTRETTIESLTFHQIEGRCLLIDESSIHVDQCWFVDVSYTRENTFKGNGSAISAYMSNLSVDNSVFLACRTNRPHGGAVYLTSKFDNTYLNSIKNSYFIDNKGNPEEYEDPDSRFRTGGAISASANIEIEQCSFIGNRSPGKGGAIALGPHRTAVVFGCHFSDNQAQGGGAIYLGKNYNDGVTVISGNHFENGLALNGGYGGAIANGYKESIRQGQVWIVDNEFNSNQAEYRGGALALTGAPILALNEFLNNRSDHKGGALWLSNPRELNVPRESALVIACQFRENVSKEGGAMLTETGGLLHQKSETNHIRVEQCEFINNSATETGGVLAALDNSSVFYRGCHFEYNEAPLDDVFFNPEGLERPRPTRELVSAAGCFFGSNGNNELGDHWFNGPGNSFTHWTPPLRVAWSRRVYSGIEYWPPADPFQILVELPYELDALAFLPDGDILFSLKKSGSITGLQGGPQGDWVDKADIVRYRPDGYGGWYGGRMEFYLDGSDVGLTTHGENIDALTVDDQGRLYISITGGGKLPGLGQVKNRSILRLTTAALGAESVGTWEHLIDGRDIGLNLVGENIDGLDLVPAAEGAEISFLISVKGNFQAPGFDEEFAEPQLLQFDATYLRTNESETPTTGSWKIFQGGTDWVYPSSGSINYAALID